MKEINLKNKEKIQMVLSEVQNKCKVRTIDILDIEIALEKVEKFLGISKKAMQDISVEIDYNAEKFPSSYKYTPESTIFRARYYNGSWRIVDVSREITHAPTKAAVINLTECAKQAILESKKYVEL